MVRKVVVSTEERHTTGIVKQSIRVFEHKSLKYYLYKLIQKLKGKKIIEVEE